MSRIEDYALLGDLQTRGTGVSTDGLDRLALPAARSTRRPASRPCSTPPTPATGCSRPPRAQVCTSRRYVEDTVVLETEWASSDGTVQGHRLHAPARSRAGRRADRRRGQRRRRDAVRAAAALRLRAGGALGPPPRRRMEAIAGPDRGPAAHVRRPWRARSWATVSEFTVRRRGPGAVRAHLEPQPPSRRPEPVDAEARAGATPSTFWTDWSQRGQPGARAVPGRHQAVADHAEGADLRARPAGSSRRPPPRCRSRSAAPRNWDYRYCWLRDSTYTLQALISAGYLEEAKAWREWLLRAIAGDPTELQIMYALDGTRRLPEVELPWLAGYENSRPGAYRQRGLRPAAARRLGRDPRRPGTWPATPALAPRATTPGTSRSP